MKQLGEPSIASVGAAESPPQDAPNVCFRELATHEWRVNRVPEILTVRDHLIPGNVGSGGTPLDDRQVAWNRRHRLGIREAAANVPEQLRLEQWSQAEAAAPGASP